MADLIGTYLYTVKITLEAKSGKVK